MPSPNVYKVIVSNKDDSKAQLVNEDFVSAFKFNEKSTRTPKPKASNLQIISVMAAKQATNTLIANYGNLTGDYVMQSSIGAITEIGSMVAMSMTGPVGVTAALLSAGAKAAGFLIEREKQNQTANYLRERTGLNR